MQINNIYQRMHYNHYKYTDEVILSYYIVNIFIMQSEQAPKQSQQQYDTFLYRFQQQIISAWKPVPRTSSNVILYTVLTVVCVGLGLGLIISAPTYEQVNVEYSSLCPLDPTFSTTYNPVCTFNFTLTAPLPAPIFIYYGLSGFYQNHRHYIQYVSPSQLKDGTLSESQAQATCGNFITNAQCGYTTSTTGLPLNGSATAFPCGTVPAAYNKIQKEIKSYRIVDANNNNIGYSQQNISYFSDIGRHKNMNLNLQAVNVEEETWLVWFRPGARSVFSKLNGIIHNDLPAGTYKVTFLNHLNYAFGSKSFSLSKANFVGNRDLFLGIAFLVLGTICVFLLIIFLVKLVNQKRTGAKTD